MSGVTAAYNKDHKVFIIKTAENPKVYRGLRLAGLKLEGMSVKLVDCDIGELISNGSVEIYDSTIKTARVSGPILAKNSEISMVSSGKTVIDLGDNRLKQIDTSNVIYVRPSSKGKVTPFFVRNGVDIYLAKGSRNKPVILSAL